jgi:hypothetical protein
MLATGSGAQAWRVTTNPLRCREASFLAGAELKRAAEASIRWSLAALRPSPAAIRWAL